MRILIVSEYSRDIASARARVYAYLPLLQQAGAHARVWWVSSSFTVRDPLTTRLRRIALAGLAAAAAPRYDAVLAHRIFPRPTALSRALGARSRRLVFDVDEAYHVDHLGNDAPASAVAKLQAMLRACHHAIVSNDYLRDYAQQHARQVSVIPTPVVVDAYPRRTHTQTRPVVIGWVGSGGAQQYLESLAPVFRRLHDRYKDDVSLLVVTAPVYRVTLDVPIAVRQMDWVLEDEHRYFEHIDIGIMPLPENRRSLGKASYKLIEYMASQIPCVASPVGTNREVLGDGDAGLLAASIDDWYDALCRLIEDRALRQRLGDRGRAIAAARYDVHRWFGPFVGVLTGRQQPRAREE